MSKCRRCDTELPALKADWPARCPSCREPLFERAGGPQLLGEARDARRGSCAVHPGNVAVGNCSGCGQRYCSVCRTRWRDQVRCLSCVEKKLEDEEEGPAIERQHRRHALLAVVFGLSAWLLLILSLLILPREPATAAAESKLVLSGLLFLLSVVPASAGLGQAIAALLGNAGQRWFPLSGLLLNGLHLGLFLGVLVLRVGRY